MPQPVFIETGVTPPDNPSDGQEFYNVTTGTKYIYDGTRAKWLSVSVEWVGAARDASNTTDQYMSAFDGVRTNLTGWRVPDDATIVGVAMQTDGASTWTVELRRNDTAAVIASKAILASNGTHDMTLDVDVNAGDFLQFYCNGTGVDRPMARFWYRFRLATS